MRPPLAPLPSLEPDADGVLTLDLRPWEGFIGYQRFYPLSRQVEAAMESAKAIVLDLRAHDPQADFLLIDEFDTILVTRPVTMPSERRVMHSGYRPQDAGSSAGYYTSFVALPRMPRMPAPGVKPRRVTFLIDSLTPLPPLARALQEAGAAEIVSEGPPNLEGTSSRMPVELSNSYTVWIRTGERIDDSTPALPEILWRPDERYAAMTYPPVEYRLLAVARMWGIIHYFYPYLDLIGDWDAVLPPAIEQMIAAKDQDEYTAAAIETMRHVADTHTSVSGTPSVTHLTGGRSPIPAEVRLIAGKAVITRIYDAQAATGLAVGDVILSVDGEPIGARIERLSQWIASSNDAGLRLLLSYRLASGDENSTAALTVEKADGTTAEVRVPRKRSFFSTKPPGEPWRLLSPDLGYVDLRLLTVDQVDPMVEAMRGTKAILFDMRGYPNSTAVSLARRFNPRGVRYGAVFHRKLVQAPIGTETDFSIEFRQELPRGDAPQYAGRTFMLVDERTISQAEHTGLWLEAGSGTKFIGSQTAGADGDVTWFYLPGNLRVNFTGHDVRHTAGRQLQRIGLVPDLEVHPTLAGIRAGRDEVLERAVEWVRAR